MDEEEKDVDNSEPSNEENKDVDNSEPSNDSEGIEDTSEVVEPTEETSDIVDSSGTSETLVPESDNPFLTTAFQENGYLFSMTDILLVLILGVLLIQLIMGVRKL